MTIDWVPRVVRSGEHASGLAYARGTTVAAVWTHPKNAEYASLTSRVFKRRRSSSTWRTSTSAAATSPTGSSYDVTWPYGRFVAPDANLRFAPGQVAIRRARIEEFCLDRLTPAKARATVLEVR